MNVAFIVNDDADMRRLDRERFAHDFPSLKVREFEDILSAWKTEGRCDILLIDISAVCPIVYGPEHAYSPILSFLAGHPGTNVIIQSGVSDWFGQDVVDRVKEMNPEAQIEFCSIVDPEITVKAMRRILGK